MLSTFPNPLTLIPWTNAWWTLGPEFKALGIADGGAVTTWPDEIGAADMTRSGAGPVFRSSVSQLGGRSAVETDGARVMRTAAAAISVTLPYTVYAVFRPNSAAGNVIYVAGQAGATMAPIASIAGAWMLLFGAAGSTGIPAHQNYLEWVSVAVSGTSDKYNINGATGTVNAGDTLLTRIAVGGAADETSMVSTQLHFMGIYQGDLTLHAKFAELLRVS